MNWSQRWCSDVLEIVCWNGEMVHLAFALDCCDREVPAFVATAHPTTGAEIHRLLRKTLFARYGDTKPEVPIEWLSDNEGIYTALETVIQAERLRQKSPVEFCHEQQTVADIGCLTK